MQPRCPSTDEWINKLWYIQTMKQYSAVKIYEVALYETAWMFAFKKEYIWISSNEVDETRAYYTEWSKSGKKKKKPTHTVN